MSEKGGIHFNNSEELKEALYRAAVAEKIADRALEMALKALSKVEAMEKSTHKAYFVNPSTNPEELTPPHPHDNPPISEQELEQKLDNLFRASQGELDVFTEGD